jgi:hypothetical protein
MKQNLKCEPFFKTCNFFNYMKKIKIRTPIFEQRLRGFQDINLFDIREKKYIFLDHEPFFHKT